jgi:hypothetical protein
MCAMSGLMDEDWGSRIFAAMDTDNTVSPSSRNRAPSSSSLSAGCTIHTRALSSADRRVAQGAIDAYEFVDGLRVMCSSGRGNDAEERAVRFAFDVLDSDGDGFISRDELHGVVAGFEAQVREVAAAWVHEVRFFGQSLVLYALRALLTVTRSARSLQFEDMFGVFDARQHDGASRQTLLQLNVLTQEAIDRICDRAYSSIAEVGGGSEGADEEISSIVGPGQFAAWYQGATRTRLHIVPFLAALAQGWIAWMQLPRRERERRPMLLVVPSLRAFAAPQPAAPQIEKSDLTLDPASDAGRGLRELFHAFASHGQMSLDDFHCCFMRLGVQSSYLRSRLFEVLNDEGSRFFHFECVVNVRRRCLAVSWILGTLVL